MLKLALLLVGSLIIATTGVAAQERFALVIGNSAYGAVASHPTAGSDAELIASQLTDLGFDVTLVQDAGLVDMKRSMGRYGKRLQEADGEATGLFFYAGHGVNADGVNYLLPTDVSIEDASDLEFVAINAAVLNSTFGADSQAQNLVILDCCAESPFGTATGSIATGLLEMQALAGNYIAFSAPANGASPARGLFANTLAEALTTPGNTIEAALEQVNSAIVAELGDSQAVFISSALKTPFLFSEAAPQVEVAAITSPASTVIPVPLDGSYSVRIDEPLTAGSSVIVGHTIADILKNLSPAYPPIEGLPDSYWREENCTNCHDWKPENLCEQASFYLRDGGEEYFTKEHPFGGTFKQNLYVWALGGCL